MKLVTNLEGSSSDKKKKVDVSTRTEDTKPTSSGSSFYNKATESTTSAQNHAPYSEPEKTVYANTGSEQGVGGILNDLVVVALNKGASDIHIEPTEEAVVVRYRIDGILRDAFKIEKKYEESLIFKIKVNAKLRTDEHFAPQDGRITFEVGKKVDTRISILPTTKGEKVVMRLLSKEGKSFKLEDLGMGEEDLLKVTRAYLKPYGSIIVSGPTGSGKTTTLYSILQIINSRDINITTVEDPVEYEIEGVNHVQINVKAGLTFAKGLRSILRQDPNIIMIGEIRDAETAEIATNSAMTGHLVLSTIHTNDAITTIPRLIDMGVDPYLIANTLNVVIAQRLARRLCQKCKVEYKITQKDLDALSYYRPDLTKLLKPEETVFKETGCKECASGFKGRVGLYEVLEITEEMQKLILLKTSTDEIFKVARSKGLKLIVEDGIDKLRKGITSLSEVMRVTALK